MGGKAGGIIGIVLGAVLIVAGIVTGGSTIMMGVMLIAAGAASLAFAPKTPDQEAAVSQELNVAPASVGHPCPVVFGIVRVTPNFINYDLDHFEAVEVFAEPQGGKGGADQPKQSMGFDYFLKWEYGLCMGEVDAIGQIYSMPGEVKMLETDDWNIFSGDYIDLTLDAEAHGGSIRIYKGSDDQTRVSSSDVYYSQSMNYRNVAWVLMGLGDATTQGFKMGQVPQPNTYQFMVRRLPKCIRDDDTTVAIPTRGSLNVSDYQYYEANPAAIIYEILTNKVWGRGLSSDIIDEASFIATGEYFATHKLGMSFKIDAQEGIGDVLEGIRKHLKTILTWDGETYKIKTLLDADVTHEFIQTLKSDEISDLQINRPLWDNTINELRAEFVSKDRSHRTDMVHVQNLATKEIMGGWITTERMNLSGFSDPTVIGTQLLRLLTEMSYPYMSATWEMNRYKSQIEVGDCVRIVWSEFNDGPVTAYFLVLTIEDGASDDENIKVTAVEDTLLAPVTGEELTVTLPSNYAWEYLDPPTGSDIGLHVPPSGITEKIDPIVAFEFPPLATGGDQAVTIITGEKTNTQMVGIQGMWSTDGTGFTIFGVSTTFGVTGTLDEDITTLSYWDRSAGYSITMTDSAKLAKLLAVTACVEPTDDLEAIPATFLHYVLIGEEIMQVGTFEDLGGGQVRMKNLVRGMFGSPIQYHATDDVVVYLEQKSAGFPSNDLPEDAALYFKGYPVGLWNTTFALGDNITTDDGTYYGKGRRPMAPEFIKVEDLGGDQWKIWVRPRWSTRGTGVNPFYDVMKNPVGANDEGIGLAILEIDATNTATTSWVRPVTVEYHPDALNDDDVDKTESGALSFTYGEGATTKLIRIYQTRNGRTSSDYLEIVAPV